jgi:hypothetical protein
MIEALKVAVVVNVIHGSTSSGSGSLSVMLIIV